MKRFAVLLAFALLPVQPVRAQDAGTIAGTVTARESTTPLAGARISLLGTRLGASTGSDGRYALPSVPPGTYHLRVRLIGYAPAEQLDVVVAAGQTVTTDFRLEAQAVQLDEIVAIGYAEVQRRDVTGSVASASGADVLLKAAPTTAVSNALQGKAPGVQVVVNSGIPGSGASVRIRGTASISANSEPLYVVDGVPAVQGSGSQDPTYNPLNEINPNDIESIDFLKDASATAIYGARGANGVVLIRTKRGTRGEDRVTIESSYGIQHVTKRIPVLGAQEFAELVNEGYVNAGRALPRYCRSGLPGCDTVPEHPIWTSPTYNYPEMMLRTAPQQNHAITFSGGDDKTRYLISGNYLSQEGVVINSGFERYGIRLNLDRTLSDRFRTGTSVSLTRIDQALNRTENGGIGAGARGILSAMNFDPSLPPKDSIGEWNQRAIMGEQLENPLANTLELVDKRNEWRVVGNVFGELDVTDALRLKGSVGTNAHFWRNPYFAPRTIAPGADNAGEAAMYSGHERELTGETTVNYRRSLGPGSLDVLGGFSVQTYQNDSDSAYAENFPADEIAWYDLGAASGRRVVDTDFSDWALVSYLGRLNYNVLDRYLFTLTARRDGSSRFGVNNKWAFFPSAAFAWRVSDEPFMPDRTIFNDLKLRISYGTTGNQAVTQYQSLSRLSTRFIGLGTTEGLTLAPSNAMPNPDLKWETKTEFNAGIDAGFANNRVQVTFDVYHSVTRDLLLVTDVPRTSGYDTQLRNIGSVKNRGVELGISTLNLQTAKVSWRSSLNLSANRNRVVGLGGQDFVFPGTSRYGWFLDSHASHIVKVGEPLGAIYGYQVNGLWQQGDACYLTDASQCAAGEYKVADLNADGKIDLDDRTILGYSDPKFYGGLTNNLTYGPFTLDAFVTFSYGNKIANVSNVFTMLSTGFMNERAEVKDRWTPQHTDTDIPRANNARPRRLYSTFVEDGSFLRLQTVTLGYQVPSGLIRGVSSARLYLTGQNLFVLSDYSGFDPEVNSIGGDSRFRGVDSGAYPRARVVNVGVSLAF
jgi:TonB-linked SusC/RagA family outer membrane protein